VQGLIKKKKAEAWERWNKKYGQVSGREYLLGKVPQGIDPPTHIWNQNSITAFENSTYMPLLDSSLCEILVDTLGLWWKDPMHKYADGMEALVDGFLNKGDLKDNIIYGVNVDCIEYNDNGVTVTGNTWVNTRTFKANAVILTVPINIMANIEFKPNLPPCKHEAMIKVHYIPSTKVEVQFREQFWQQKGGFTKSTSRLGQVHYPTTNGDHIKRGVLICYTWNNFALAWRMYPN